jgi:hypothetical protein
VLPLVSEEYTAFPLSTNPGEGYLDEATRILAVGGEWLQGLPTGGDLPPRPKI